MSEDDDLEIEIWNGKIDPIEGSREEYTKKFPVAQTREEEIFLTLKQIL